MKLKIIRKQPICVSKLTVCENLAETVGFEPTDPKDQRISSVLSLMEHRRKSWSITEHIGAAKCLKIKYFQAREGSLA